MIINVESKNVSINNLLKDYLDYLEIEKGRSTKTRSNYEHYLNVFFKQADVNNVNDLT